MILIPHNLRTNFLLDIYHLWVFICLLFLLHIPATAFAETIPPRPNVIFILIDDMGWSDLSCFGGIRAKTPNIDHLAQNGLRFKNFYVNSPICSPSRVAFTTGQYPHRWGITSYLDNRQRNEQRELSQWLDPRAPTLAKALQKSGYKTGHFGKWHMGGQRDVANAPPIVEYGFDASLTNFEGMGPKLLPLTQQPGWQEPRKIWEKAEILGGPATWIDRSKITSGYVDAALQFIDQAQAAQSPFYINLWPDDVHSPFFPSLGRWVEDKKHRYDAVLEELDSQLKPLFDRIEKDPDLQSNTIILLCSDNGHEHGAGNSEPLRGAKTWLYEGGVRSPLIVYAPAFIPESQRGSWNESSVLCALDINRSLYALTATEPTTALDGEDLSETLIGKSDVSREAPIFWRRPPDRPGFGYGLDEPNPDLAVRSNQWKCYMTYAGEKLQLYDLSQDVSETRDVSQQFPDIALHLRNITLHWYNSPKN